MLTTPESYLSGTILFVYFLESCSSRSVVHVCPSGGTYCRGSSHTLHDTMWRVSCCAPHMPQIMRSMVGGGGGG